MDKTDFGFWILDFGFRGAGVLQGRAPHSPLHTLYSPRLARRGFTLVEILTVVLIISLLLGLITAAIVPARARVKIWRMQAEIKQMELAIERVKTELGGGEYPPDGADTNNNVNNADAIRFLRRAFPRASYTYNYTAATGLTAQGTGAAVSLGLRPDTAICFWLGGMRDPSGNFIGFNADPTDPLNLNTAYNPNANPPQGRIGPFFDFDRSRVSQAGAGLLMPLSSTVANTGWNATASAYIGNCDYFPQNDQLISYPASTATAGVSMTYAPFLYFKSVMAKYSDVQAAGLIDNSGEYYHAWTAPATCTQTGTAAIAVIPFKNSQAATTSLTDPTKAGTAARGWINPSSFQILCPGLDGYYDAAQATGSLTPYIGGTEGPDKNTTYAPIYPDGLNYGKNTMDDVTNFSNGKLQNDMP